MDFEFVRHDPVYDRMIFVLTLDRQKMKERKSASGSRETGKRTSFAM